MSARNHKISLSNRQGIDLDHRDLEAFLYAAAGRLQVSDGFSVVLIADEEMKDYQRRYAGKDVATDVLSFPSRGDWPMEDAYAGDVLISVETARRQARSGLLNELKVLSLHGLLHLLGYDHEEDDGEMSRLEDALKQEFRLS